MRKVISSIGLVCLQMIAGAQPCTYQGYLRAGQDVGKRSKRRRWAFRARLVERAPLLVVSVVLGWMLGTFSALNAQSLTWLGTLGGDRSIANAVSANGGVVVGYAHNAENKRRAFRWTSGGGMVNLGTLSGGTYSIATDVSANGNVIVGRADELTAQGSRPERGFWRTSGGLRSMSTFPGGYTSSALGVSPDGGWVAGWADFYDRHGYHPKRAFAVPPGSLNDQRDLGTLGGERSEARGISNNGGVIVGWSENHLGEIWAFYVRQFPNSGMRWLYPLAVCCGEANGVSDNGAIIVGRSHSAQTERWHACLWWWNGSDYTPRDLGTLGGQESEAYACTNDQTAVGWSHNAAGQRRAFRWTPTHGMEDLTAAYQNLLSSGSYLEAARDVTPDGRYIVGWGYNAATGRTEGFLLDTLCVAHNGDIDRNGCVDDADLLQVLFAFGSSGSNPADVNCDNLVDDTDLLIVLFNFGNGC